MNRFFNSILSVILCAALLSAAALPAAADTDGPINETTALLADGATLHTRTWWTGKDYVTEHYIVLAPPENAGLRPIVVSGDTLTDTAALSDMAEALEAEGLHVAAGLNGGFYTLGSGVPVGIVARDGALRSDDDGLTGLGFTADGGAFIGRSLIWMDLYTGTEELAVATLNHTRGSGPALFTADFGKKTSARGYGWNITCAFAEDETDALPLSGSVLLEVLDVSFSKGAVEIPEGCLVLSQAGAEDAAPPEWIAALAAGSPLLLTVGCAEGWEDTDSAVCLLYPLLENGELAEDLDKLNDPAPRSAVGILPDGGTVYYTVDGRQNGYSVGLGLKDVAKRLQDLGCVSAGALDGGASTQMQAVMPGDEALAEINRPYGLRTRSVANYLFLVTEAQPTGVPARLALYPLDVDAMTGAEIPLTVRAVDEFGYAAETPEDLTFTVSDGLGTVEDGVFYCENPGSGFLTVSAPDMESATIPVTVVESPDELRLYGEVYGRLTDKLTLAPGQEVDLTVRAYLNHLLLTGADENYLWELDEAAGTVDGTGHLIPAQASGQGMLTVSAGETVKEIPITVWTGIPFSDVEIGHPNFDAIRFVYEQELFKGVSDTEFEPETIVNRGMLVTVLWRMLGEPEAEAPAGFLDVPPEEWYGPAVAWAAEHGIVNGYDAETFAPEDPLTKEQIFTILWRLAGMPETEDAAPPEVYDAAEIDAYAAVPLAWAMLPDYLLTEPDADGLLLPRAPMTRAAVAEALMRYLTRVPQPEPEEPSEDLILSENDR